ncbi:MAG: TonB-dependent receptor domain-containing protein [Rhodothalassiaceae bacterium]
MRLLLVLLCLIVLSVPAAAQVSLTVRVSEAGSGAPVDGLTIELSNTATGAVRSDTTDVRGQARFGGLATAGQWVARWAGDGEYAPAQSRPVALRSGFDQAISLAVRPRTVEEVTVQGVAGSQLDRLSAEVSATFTAQDLDLIPIEGRSLDRVLFRLPNVTQATGFFSEAPAVAINGANSLFTNYTIDGLDNNENFLGGQRFPVPIGIVQDVTVLASNYSVEFGRTANGVVNVTTKSGGNELDGEVFFVTRPGGAFIADVDFPQTDLLGNPVSESFERYQAGGSIGGAIVKDRTFYFLNVEYLRDLTDNQLTSSALGVDAVIPGTNEQLLLTGRLDHRWSDRLRSTLRVNHGRVTNERQGGGLDGGVTFPSAADEQERLSTNVALTTTYVGDAWDYSASFGYYRFDWNFGNPVSGPGPQVTLLDPSGQTAAVIGNNGFIFDEVENSFQTQHKLSWDLGRHRLKAGIDYIRADFDLTGGGNINGNFTVQLSQAQADALVAADIGADFDVADLVSVVPAAADQVVLASVETQPNSFGVAQNLISLYLEDQIQVTPDFVVTLGLRWEYDSLTSVGGQQGDFNNIAPRGAFNWNFRDDMVLRGGAGLFYEKIPYAVISDALQQSTTSPGFIAQLESLIAQGILPADTDIDAVTFDGNFAVTPPPGAIGPDFGVDTAGLFALRETIPFDGDRRIINPFGLDNPFAIQATIGWQWEFARDWFVSVDGILTEGRNLLRLIDLNAPEPFVFMGTARSPEEANATRPAIGPGGAIPAGGARSIIVSDTGGMSDYRALNVVVEKTRGEDFYDLFLSYTFSRLENDTDDINFRANDANDFAADFGPSLNDRRHVLSGIFNLYPLQGLSLTAALLYQSGQPFNLVPDAAVFGTVDLNGDGLSFADQFTGNPDRAPGVSRNSGRLDDAVTVDLGAGYVIDLGPGGLELRVDVFNVFNANNETGFPVNFTVSNQIQVAGQPFQQTSAAPPRFFQFSARYLF